MAELSTAEILERVHARRLGAREAFALLRGGAAEVAEAGQGDDVATKRPPATEEPIAVIGMAGRFPGASDVESLWQNLLDGRDCVGPWPAGRWDLSGVGEEVRCRAGGFLDDAAGFDPHFFGLSPREAEHIDPQQRLFLMEAWHALEHAGHAGPLLDGARVGVFVGCAEGDYADVLKQAGQLHTSYAFMGNASAILASRLSYHLNLTGPALAVDTACSASLVAVHLACESLRRGECDMALAGGTYVMSTPRLYQLASSAGMLSPSGRCHAFGSNADGFVPAEAVGAVVLKPLSRALDEGDRVLAVVEGSGINQDGRSNGITAPNGPSQTALETGIYERFGLDPCGIGYVEAHGTGTVLGDPIEVQALAEAFGRRALGAAPCRLGSIKSNIGHAQLAAGIAGFIKLVLALQHGVVPPTLHAGEPNPHLDLGATPFVLPQAAEPFPVAPDGHRRGAISGFGFSGTNAHVVVRSQPAMPETADRGSAPVLVLLSGRDAADLADRARDLVAALENDLALADLALTLLAGRAHHRCRRALVVDDATMLRRALMRLAGQGDGAPGAGADDASPALVEEVLARLPQQPGDAGPGARKALELLARAYEQGADVGPSWLRTLFGARARRIALPGTRFRVRSYWAGARIAAAPPRTRFVIGADDPLPEAHRVAGIATVPGAALLVLAHTAAGADRALVDVRFLRAVTRTDRCDIVLHAVTDGEALTLRDERDRAVLEARIVATGDPPSAAAVEAHGAAMRGENPSRLYERFAAAGIVFGPGLRGLRTLQVGGDRVEAEVALAGDVTGAPDDVLAGAGLLDACCQAVGALAAPDQDLPLFVPVAVGRFELCRPLPQRLHATLLRRESDIASARFVVDLAIRDVAGETCALLEGLIFERRAAGTAIPAPAATLALRPCHVAAPLPTRLPGVRAVVTNGPWGQALARALRPSSSLTGGVRVVVSEPPAEGESIDAAMRRTIHAVLPACKEPLERLAAGEAVRLVHVFSDGDPWGAALAGYWRGIAAEYPALAVACLALPRDVAGETAQLPAIAGLAGEHGVSEWRLRDDRFERLELQPFDPFAGIPATPSGIVVVAGGGALGESLARDLANRRGMKVAVFGRSQQEGEELPAGGGWLLRIRADVSEVSSLSAALDRVRAHGPMGGVILTAGVIEDGLAADLTAETAHRVVLPKAGGAILLDRLTADDPLAFFVLFGALSARVGNTGQAAYGFANRFLSAFATERERLRGEGARNGLALCIDWPLWREGGMSLPPAMAASLARHVGLVPMPFETGRDLLEAAMACGEPEIVVAHGDTARLAAALGVTIAPPVRQAVAQSPVADAGQRVRLAQKLCAIVSDALPMEGVVVEPDTGLAEYDFDSIAITGLVDDLNRRFGFRLSPTAFYDARNLDDLAGHLVSRWPEAVAAAVGPAPAPEMAPTPVSAPPPRAAAPLADARAEPIAIVGFDLRVPGAGDPDTFRRNLLAGVDTASEIPAARWDWRAIAGDPARESGRTNVARGCFVEDIDRFDAAFFGIAPVEADLLDPQQRLLLETAWRAIERAGHAPRSLAGTRTGVFVGCAGYDYATVVRSADVPIEPYTATGIAPSLMANRLSFVLDLAGPSETVDTACSSSLVALDKAVRAIRSGQCEGAIVGAASAMLTPDLHIAFSRAGMLSPHGRCRSFDAGADGYVRGEGVVVLYLKPLAQARADGDTVHAVVLGSAVNHGGHATSLTAPNASAQAAVLRAAWQDAGIGPGELGHIEAHGTGTRLGDPVEIDGLRRAFAEAALERGQAPAAPGSVTVSTVKAQIGHLEGAAGLAGLVSALFAVRDGTVPGNPQLRDLNPLIEIEGTALAIEAAPRAWRGGRRRIAGISSFGFGGTNAHVVIASGPEAPAPVAPAEPGLVVLSARTEQDLERRIADLAAWLDDRCPTDRSAPAPVAPVEEVRDVLAGLLAVPPDAVAPDEPLAELGLGGTGLHRLADALDRRLGRRPGREALSVDATARTLAAGLVADVSGSPAPEAPRLPSGPVPSLAAVCRTLQAGRDAMAERLAFVARDLDELRAVLAALMRGATPPVTLHRGRAGRGAGPWQRLLARDAGRRMLADLARDGGLGDLAELWVAGADVDWALLHEGSCPRIELPPYRFAGPRHWVADGRRSLEPAKADAPDTDVSVRLFVPAWVEPAATGPAAGPVTLCSFGQDRPRGNSGVLVALAEPAGDIDPAEFLARMRRWLSDTSCRGRRTVLALCGTGAGIAALAEAASAFLASWAGEEPDLDGHILLASDPDAVRAALERIAAATTGLRLGCLLRLDGDRLLLRTLKPAPADAASGTVLPAQPVCLVTGAFGGVGRLVVRHLARRHGARLVLLARRTPGDAKDLLAAVAADGGEAIVATGDVTDRAAVAHAVAEARARFGRLDLVVHLAGTVSGGLVAGLDDADLAATLAPKVLGLHALLDATQGAAAPRILCFSSLAGWLDAPGQAAYAAANRYMDGLAMASERVTGIAWPAWADTGMAADAEGIALLQRDFGLHAMAPANALAFLDAALSAENRVIAPVPLEAGSPLPLRLSDPSVGARRPEGGGPDDDAAALVRRALGLDALPGAEVTLEEAGFSSLTAVRLVNALRDSWGVEIAVADLVVHRDVGRLLAALETRTPLRAVPAPVPQAPSSAEARDGAATEGQALIALHQALQPESYAYNMPVLFDLAEGLDDDRIAAALSALVARHAVLRTRLVRQGDGFRRIVDPAAPVVPERADGGADLRALARRPFRLAHDWPVRATLVEEANEGAGRRLLIVIHHSAADGLSLPVLHADLESLLAGATLEGAAVDYDAFAHWQHEYLESDRAARDRAWWRGQLGQGRVVPLDLGALPEAPAIRARNRGDWIERQVAPETRAALARHHVRAGRSLAAVLMAAWAVVLSRFSDDRAIRLLVPTAGHRGDGLEALVGLVMNPVVVDCRLDGARRFSDAAGIAAAALGQALSHADWPLSKLLADMAGEDGRLPALHEIAHAAFLYRDDRRMRATGLLRLRPELHHEGDFTLALEAIDRQDGGLRLVLKHDPGFVDGATAALLLDAVANLAACLAAAEDPALETPARADAADLARIAAWNAASAVDLPFEPVEAAVRRRAAEHPARPAVRDDARTWDYATLDRHADGVAAALLDAGVAAGEVVAVCVPRDAALPAALLGVMRSGAAYLPIDAALPAERIAWMLEDAGVRVAITGVPVALPAAVTAIDAHTIAPAAAPLACPVATPDDLAYVIYTSGSTGRPKGVEIGHGNLARFLQAMAARPGFGAADVMLALTTVSFDISGLELFLPLVAGGALVMVGADEARDARRLAHRLAEPGPTVVQATPSTLRLALAAGWTGGGTLRRILAGGEPMPRDLRDRLSEGTAELWNMYGPTETTIWSAAGPLAGGERITVGRPIAGTSLHVVDDAGHPCAIGVAGELWIGGAGVAAGYRGRPELTAERFVIYRDEAGGDRRVYRTGDRARWLADGRVEILGRMDRQMKLRGHRIEPGEIEATVVERLGDSACAVTLREGAHGRTELVAHVVPGPTSVALDQAERIRRLRAWLPDIMIPVHWTVVEALPLNAAGKLDRAALEAPSAAPGLDGAAGTLRNLVAQALGRPAGELDDDLPMTLLGLDSMALVDLADRVSEALGFEVTPTAFFDHPTLRELADHVASPGNAPMRPAGTAQPVAPVRQVAEVSSGDIAIIGMAGRFPDAPDVETFWANLLAGRTSFREVPPDRWDWRAVHDDRRNRNGRSYSRWIAPLDDIRGFDPGYFAMTAHEAVCTDPQQRLFAMEAIRALADAGIEAAALKGAACSVHVGAAMGDYHRLLERAGEANAFAMTGNSPSLIPARLSYHLDLKGASVAIDTACSSSLVAVHEACRGLLAGEAELAIAGGVYLMTTPLGQVLSAGANILSARGVCTPFDAAADGIVIGEAVAAVVLKPLAAALADGDPVRAVIRASDVNQDGRTNGITAPSAASQAALIGRVLARARVPGGSVGYVETHGTGTRLGDPIELDGLRTALGGTDGNAICHLGSLKANIGHSYHAAGIAGLVKAVLCVERGLLPPQPGIATLNPLLRLEDSPFRLARRAMAFATRDGAPRRAGVSSFGFSGTNAHVLVEGREGDGPADRAPVRVAFDLRDCWVDLPPEVAEVPAAQEPPAAAAPVAGADARRGAILAALAESAGCTPDALVPDASLEADLGLDSIKLMSMLSRYGGDAGGTIDGQALAGLRTVADLLDVLDEPGHAATDDGAGQGCDPAPVPAAARTIPVLPAQRLFLLGHHLIDSSSLCSWVELRGALDLAALNRAWQHVVDTSPGLRVTFHVPQGATKLGAVEAALQPAGRVPPIAAEDLSALAPEAREAALQARFEQRLNREWRLDRWPLHEISLCRLAPDAHALLVTDEHVVVDGIGNQRLLAALLETYDAIVQGRPLPPGTDDAAFVAALEGLAAHGASIDARAPGGAPYQWDPSGRAIETWTPRFTVSVTEATRERTRVLAETAAALGGTVNAALVLALARAAARTMASDGPVAVQMPTSGRVAGEIDAGMAIGCFAQNMPVELPAALLAAPWPQALREFAAVVRERLDAGADWSMAVALARVIEQDVPLVDGKVPSSLRPLFRGRLRSNLYSPYIGDAGLPAAAGGLTLARYRAGTVNGPATVDLLHEVFDGRLHSAWNWDAAHFRPDDIAALRAAFEAEIDACLAAAPVPVPPSGPAVPVVLPPVLDQALQAVCGAPLPPWSRETALEPGLGLDSLKRVRLVAKLPAVVRADPVLRRRLLSATTMGALVDAFDGAGLPETVGAVPPIARILECMRADPHALAVSGPDGSFTYGELDDVTARLAVALAGRGLKAGSRAALLLGRGRWFVACAVAVMRAGAAYVPLDPAYPVERSRYVLGHAAPAVLLTTRELAPQARAWLDGGHAAPALVVVDDGADRAAWQAADPDNAARLPAPSPDDAMVVLYTSGSTGRPKGVVLAHRGYANRLEWHQARFALQPGEGVLQKTSVCFDVSVWELFWPLMHGGTVRAVDTAGARDPWALAEAMRADRIAVMHFVPSMFGEFLAAMESEPETPSFPDLRWVVLSGEALPPALVRRWFDLLGPEAAPLANLYGPTEASIDVTCEVLHGPPPPEAVRISIGAAIDNVALHVLDEDLRAIVDETPGELAIGGVQLARGYLDAPELTSAAFVEVDLPGEGRCRLYRTGDLVRRLSDGRFDFLGRRDNQVKLRGYRIELDEIEAVLREADGVGEATVLVEGEGGDARLVAWIAPRSACDPEALRAACAARLPDWMVPARFLACDTLPRTANGKLDRKALADTAPSAEGQACAPLAPAQRWLVHHFPPPHAWWGYTRFLCERRLDPSVIEAAFHHLAGRHEALRTIYRRDATGGWRQEVLPPHTTGAIVVEVQDVEGRSADDIERLVETTLRARCEAFLLDRLPHNHALTLRHGPARWEFCLANHHIDGDFIGAAVLFREFWAIHDGLERTGIAPALPAPAPGPAALARHLAEQDAAGALEADRRFWCAIAAAAGGFSFAPDRPDGTNREADGDSLELVLDAAATRRLRQGCRERLGITLYPVLAAPLYGVLATLTGAGKAVVSHRTSGRTPGSGGPDVAEAVGNFAVHYPVALEMQDRAPHALCVALAAALDAVPRGGLGYDWLGASLGAEVYPDERLTPVRLNYLGVLPPEVQGALRFPRHHHNRRLAPDGQRRSADIEIHLAVRDDCLVIAAGWSGARWDRSRIADLATRYRDALAALSGSLYQTEFEP